VSRHERCDRCMTLFLALGEGSPEVNSVTLLEIERNLKRDRRVQGAAPCLFGVAVQPL